MSEILTDRAAESVPAWVNLLKLGLWLFVGYAASRHVAWEDAVAGTFLFAQVVRAVGQRQGKSDE